MIKFAPKQYKQNYLPIKKEKQIFIYKYLLTLSGALQLQTIDSNTWKYLLHFHSYYKGITSFSRARPICGFTGRTRGLYRFFQFSRMKVREAVKEGIFLGISKSSW